MNAKRKEYASLLPLSTENFENAHHNTQVYQKLDREDVISLHHTPIAQSPPPVLSSYAAHFWRNCTTMALNGTDPAISSSSSVRSAAIKVLSSYELLERILCLLPTEKLYVLLRTNSTFRDVMQRSKIVGSTMLRAGVIQVNDLHHFLQGPIIADAFYPFEVVDVGRSRQRNFDQPVNAIYLKLDDGFVLKNKNTTPCKLFYQGLPCEGTRDPATAMTLGKFGFAPSADLARVVLLDSSEEYWCWGWKGSTTMQRGHKLVTLDGVIRAAMGLAAKVWKKDLVKTWLETETTATCEELVKAKLWDERHA